MKCRLLAKGIRLEEVSEAEREGIRMIPLLPGMLRGFKDPCWSFSTEGQLCYKSLRVLRRPSAVMTA